MTIASTTAPTRRRQTNVKASNSASPTILLTTSAHFSAARQHFPAQSAIIPTPFPS
ncbi:MAG: hypothetical protein ACWGKN_06420 [Desulfoprunum sp.]|jgi:hypothetical protein